jgi:hypothetical protein
VYWEDATFAADSRVACQDTRPAGIRDLETPTHPPDKEPGSRNVHMVVADLIDPDGAFVDPPPVPADLFYYGRSAFGYGTWYGYPREYRDLIADGPDDVDLLACIALRTAEGADYIMGGAAETVYQTDAIIWMVDARSGTTMGRPWVWLSSGEFEQFLTRSDLSTAGPLSLLVPTGSIFGQQIVSFLGLVTPMPGAYQQLQSYSPGDELLPEGVELYDQTSVVRLIVFEDQVDRIAFVEVFCAPGGTTNGESLRIGTDVPVELGLFEARSDDVALEGEFTRADRATGRIRARDAAADRCGVPEEAEWTASHMLLARPDGDGYTVEAIHFPGG